MLCPLPGESIELNVVPEEKVQNKPKKTKRDCIAATPQI